MLYGTTHIVVSMSSTIGSHICRFLGYVVSLQAHSCNEMGSHRLSILYNSQIHVSCDEMMRYFSTRSEIFN